MKPELHRLGIVAIDAGHRILHVLDGLLVRHRVEGLESFDEIAAAGLAVGHHHGSVAMEAGSRLLHSLLTAGEDLVLEHVGVSTALAEILRERVSRVDRDQARVTLEARARDHRARIGLRRRARQRFAAAVLGAHLIDGAQVLIVLERKVLSPYRRILRGLGELNDAIERILRLLLAREDVDEQGDQGGHGDRGEDGREQRRRQAATTRLGHITLLCASAPRCGDSGRTTARVRARAANRWPRRWTRGNCGTSTR